MSTTRDELEEELSDAEYALDVARELNERNEWLADDVNKLVDAIRLNHDTEHWEAWQWCEWVTCKMIREHDLQDGAVIADE